MDLTKPIAVLFDFDGVVMDTEKQYSKFWGEQGREHLPDIEDFDRIIKGQTLVQIYEKYFAGQDELQYRISQELTGFEQQMSYEYITGVEDFICELKEKGVKMAVVTSSNHIKMQNVYRLHPEFISSFDRILTADLFAKSKPDPDCFLLGARVFDTVPENCFVFEDSFHGLAAGNSAGMTVIGLATTNPYEAIVDKAHHVMTDFVGFTFERMMSYKRQIS